MNTLLKQKREFEKKFGEKSSFSDWLTKENTKVVWKWIEKAIKEAREEGYKKALKDIKQNVNNTPDNFECPEKYSKKYNSINAQKADIFTGKVSPGGRAWIMWALENLTNKR